MPQNAKLVFKGKLFEVWQWEQKMFDGTTQVFERLRRPNTAQVLAAIKEKVLVQMERQPDSEQSFISLPGGRFDEGEPPLEAAKRELLEESGYVSNDWVLWREDNPVGKIEWTVYTYAARNCTRAQEPRLDVGEKIDPRLISFDEFLLLPDEPTFYSPEIVPELLRMRIDDKKRAAFRTLLFG